MTQGRKARAGKPLAKLKDAELDPRFHTEPVELVQEFLRYFKIDPDGKSRGRITLETPVSKDVLEELAERFALYLLDGESLEKAFGGSTGRGRQKLETVGKAWQATAAVLTYQREGLSFEIAVERAAKDLNTSAANIKKLFTGTAPPWHRPGRKISEKE